MYKPFQVYPNTKLVRGRECWSCDIFAEEYERCEKSAMQMWSRTHKRKGECPWNGGMLNTNEDPIKTERTGRLGEMAFAKMFDVEIDLEYSEYGDKYDCLINNLKIDIKNSARFYEPALVRSRNENGRDILLDKDLYVFGFLNNENITRKFANVVLIGWTTLEFVKKQPLVNGKYGNYKNKEVPFNKMFEMKNLDMILGIETI